MPRKKKFQDKAYRDAHGNRLYMLMLAYMDPKRFELWRSNEQIAPSCGSCGHPFKAHTEGVGCLHRGCWSERIGAPEGSACPGYIPADTDTENPERKEAA